CQFNTVVPLVRMEPGVEEEDRLPGGQKLFGWQYTQLPGRGVQKGFNQSGCRQFRLVHIRIVSTPLAAGVCKELGYCVSNRFGRERRHRIADHPISVSLGLRKNKPIRKTLHAGRFARCEGSVLSWVNEHQPIFAQMRDYCAARFAAALARVPILETVLV